MTTIYLSSIYEDLNKNREPVKLKALHQSGDMSIVLQDYLAANYRPGDARDLILPRRN